MSSPDRQKNNEDPIKDASSCDCQENIEDPIKDASNFDCKKNIRDRMIITIKGASNSDCKKNIVDGLIITAVVATTAGIFFALRVVDVKQPKALFLSTVAACLLSLPM